MENPKLTTYGCVKPCTSGLYNFYFGAICRAANPEEAERFFGLTWGKRRSKGWRAVPLQDNGYPVAADMERLLASIG